MIVLKFGTSQSNVTLYIANLWVLIPLFILVDYLSIKLAKKIKIKLDNRKEKKRIEAEQKKLKELKKKFRLLKIFCIANDQFINGLQVSGGENVIVNPINNNEQCYLGNNEQGIWYLEDNELSKTIFYEFRQKAINGVIYITKTALCQYLVTHRYSNNLISNWFVSIGSRISFLVGIMDVQTFIIDLAGVALLILPMTTYGVTSVFIVVRPLFFKVMSSISMLGGSVIFYNHALADKRLTTDMTELSDSDKDKAKSVGISAITRRRKNSAEVICLDPVPVDRPTIQMQTPAECSIAYNLKSCQAVKESTGITFRYNDVVNMRDVLPAKDGFFIDIYEIGYVNPPELKTGLNLDDFKPTLSDEANVSPAPVVQRVKSKMVNFLQKFSDPENIPDSETWDRDTLVSSPQAVSEGKMPNN